MTFDIARDAPPFVLGVGTVLKRAAAVPALAKRLRRMKGVLGLRSSIDPQTATIRFARGRISLRAGVADDASMVITMNPSDASAKPKVEGAAKHPLFALHVAKVMEPPKRTWREEAEAFWAFASPTPRMPARMRLICTDEGTELTLGASDGPTYEVYGTADALASTFSGASILGQDMLDGKLMCVGMLEHGSIVTGRSIAWALGEGR